MVERWNFMQIKKLFHKPLLELIFDAQSIHRKYFNPLLIQISTLLSIKTGNCPEDCKYCSQSVHYKTNLKTEKLMDIDKILIAAQKAKNSGSKRFCMGAAWRNPKDRDMTYLTKIIQSVKSLGMETCMTLGHLSYDQAQLLYQAGLDFYNHNLDTSPEFYQKVISTRKYQDRLNTIDNIVKTGIKLCSGGILGLGETMNDRINFLLQLVNLPKLPESVPINMLVKIKGTPLENNDDIEPFDFIRTIAVARIIMPRSYIRLSAGREKMNEQTQAMCFMSGANSIFYGCKLLTTVNSNIDKDVMLFNKLGLKPEHINDKNNNS
ncbi:MAG: biotin synthase BioB [Pantoea sp. Brub]|nr:biotin synthase BioB [Pantoea sp. Brub]